MASYEDHIEILQNAEGLPSETAEAAGDAIAFVAALHGLFVDQGVLNDEAEIDVNVLENLTDAYHGELAAAALLLSEDSFTGMPELLRGTARSMPDDEGVVPVVVKKGFERLANRIEQTRRMKAEMAKVLEARALEEKAAEETEKKE